MSQKQFKNMRKRHVRESLKIFKGYLSAYEVAASWWACWMPGDFLQDITARHFERKVRRKYKRFAYFMQMSQENKKEN